MTSPAGQELLERIAHLNVDRSGGQRKPHKPLLLLLAIAELRRGRRSLSLAEIEEPMRELLEAYAPPVKGRPNPALPYWHLRSDGLWVVVGADDLEVSKGGFPLLPGLRESVGHFPQRFVDALATEPGLATAAVTAILERHFGDSLHPHILADVGFALDEIPPAAPRVERLVRDSSFSPRVLEAYEHRCAVTGFRASLGRTYLGVEAAHVMWHCEGGPAMVDNGLALQPTLHVLLDRGAWTLTDDRRVLVSKKFTGSDEAIDLLRGAHGRSLRAPLPGCPPVSTEYIRWHRDPARGGVFREPGLPL